MTTHDNKDIDKLVMDLKLQCTYSPKTIWMDRQKRRFVAKSDKDLAANTELWMQAVRFVYIDTINKDTDNLLIRLKIEEAIRGFLKETPVHTSLSNSAERIQRTWKVEEE